MGGYPHPSHIVLFPFMAQGHLIPFLSLAKLIHHRYPGRFAITLVSTPLNVRRLRASLPSDSPILLRDLPFSAADHGLPPEAENTDSLRYDDIAKLFQASETLQPHFERLLSDIAERDGRAPLCVVGDVILGWTVVSARKLGTFHATFSTCGAFGMAAYVAMWLHLPHLRTDAEDFPVPGFPDGFRLHRSQLARNIRDTDGNDVWGVFLRRQISLCLGSGGLLCNTVEEVETTGMELFRKVAGLPVWAIGPVLPNDGRPSDSRTGKKAEVSVGTFVEWLARHPPASVLYVSFGSQNGDTRTIDIDRERDGKQGIGDDIVYAGHHGDYVSSWQPRHQWPPCLHPGGVGFEHGHCRGGLLQCFPTSLPASLPKVPLPAEW